MSNVGISNKLIFDFGLHKGEDAAYYLSRGFKVVGVEADPDLIEHCKKRFDEETKRGQLILLHGAVVDDESLESVPFYKNSKVSVWGTVSREWAERNAKLGANSIVIDVPVIRFSEVLKKYGTPYYLKLDIEGEELNCLRKLRNVENKPSYISIESEKLDFSKLKIELDTFRTLGYRKINIQQQASVVHQTVPKNTKEGIYIDYRFEWGSSGLFGTDLPGDWLDQEAAIKKFESIHSDYRRYGYIRSSLVGRYVLAAMQRLAGRGFPGWYDTHARLE